MAILTNRRVCGHFQTALKRQQTLRRLSADNATNTA